MKKKNHACQLILKKFMLWPKKMHTRNLMRKKIPAARTFPSPLPPPPHNFSDGPSIKSFELYGERQRKRN